jgi:tRNA-dihydrouridine synthase B
MINLNSGCPARKIIDAGSGAALMANIPLLKELIKIIIKKVNGKIPVTIKIRAGYNEKNGLEVAQISEFLGIDGIIIHPRLKTQGFTGELDFDLVKKIKQTVKIPIIFSGNIIDGQSASKTYDSTGVDGIMIGRALYGAPWKIKQILSELLGEHFEITEKEKMDLAIKHLKLNSKFYGLKHGFNVIKQHLPYYIKNIPDAAKIRHNLVLSQSEQEVETILIKLRDRV